MCLQRKFLPIRHQIFEYSNREIPGRAASLRILPRFRRVLWDDSWEARSNKLAETPALMREYAVITMSGSAGKGILQLICSKEKL